mmetsp:Transcript_4311/g.7192  ORF Transcript_4311/g.7192 Transcript_4311/m.7192 type:complete len:239 (+) Transcript_4311:24-740(+)|eukprot:CAMPEP_0119013642 /NCGR_PEP_ID=MMETSP1176-20130426/8655_1 /TAXON_ID=265551 /ORGANISM="Synedropsis recta cf, Strain CCMP1620" /LENGTH=238 /DNA_ID=CAMNT_0006966747 /DNA_START=23 /DNA_END=739 /DNA_ORIENTATION=+
MSVAKLVPLLDVDDPQDNRPSLRLYDSKPIVIGRNNFNTTIDKVEISRELLKLEWKDGTLHVIPLKEQHFIRVRNDPLVGERILDHGDVLSLYKDHYSYQVRYAEASNKASELSSEAKRKLTDHLACPICMELLVAAVIVVPCGHRFCKNCSSSPDCATCRTPVQSRIPDRLLDGLLADLVKERCVDADDSTIYLKRTGNEALPPTPAASLQTPQRKRRRKRQGHAPPSADTEVIVLS